jgi:hypothetical protein
MLLLQANFWELHPLDTPPVSLHLPLLDTLLPQPPLDTPLPQPPLNMPPHLPPSDTLLPQPPLGTPLLLPPPSLPSMRKSMLAQLLLKPLFITESLDHALFRLEANR